MTAMLLFYNLQTITVKKNIFLRYIIMQHCRAQMRLVLLLFRNETRAAGCCYLLQN
jgi:hypothetical protein